MRTTPLVRFVVVTAATAAALLLAGCSTTTGPATTKAPDLPRGDESYELDPTVFSATIDNPYWPMVPGTRSIYQETAEDGSEKTVVVTITSETKKLANGITARVVRDSVFEGDQLIEDTFDWYAQDADGTIWYLGEDTAEFENGKVVSTEGSFEAGVDGAMGGVVVPAAPRSGQQYRQEYYRGQAEDNGEIMRLTELVDVPYGHYEDVLTTRDTSSIEPDVVEYKFYAKDVGPVMTLDIAGGTGREVLVSVETVPDGTGTSPLGQPD